MAEPMALLDTHQHLIYPELFHYPWTAGIPQLDGLGFRYEDYLAASGGCGISSTVFMETVAVIDPMEHGETVFADELAADPRSLLAGVVASCRPENAGFSSWLDSLEGTRVVGLRRILHVEPDDLSRSDQFRENVRQLAGRGLTFDMCFLARQLPLAFELAEACPNVSFVLDHCGVPDIAANVLDPWREHITRIAELPNVACKVSGVLAYCRPDNASIEAVRPYVEHCVRSFGWNRVVWGSDWPVVNITASLRQWVSITREVVAGESAENRRKLFHENARLLYGLDRVSVAR